MRRVLSLLVLLTAATLLPAGVLHAPAPAAGESTQASLSAGQPNVVVITLDD